MALRTQAGPVIAHHTTAQMLTTLPVSSFSLLSKILIGFSCLSYLPSLEQPEENNHTYDNHKYYYYSNHLLLEYETHHLLLLKEHSTDSTIIMSDSSVVPSECLITDSDGWQYTEIACLYPTLGKFYFE